MVGNMDGKIMLRGGNKWGVVVWWPSFIAIRAHPFQLRFNFIWTYFIMKTTATTFPVKRDARRVSCLIVCLVGWLVVLITLFEGPA